MIRGSGSVVSSPAPIPPRWGTPRRADRATRGPLLGEVAQLLGWRLHPWQQHAAAVALEIDRRTRAPYYRTVGIGVARQNGKTTLVCSRIAMQLMAAGSTVVYTAQDRNLARFKWEEHVALLMSTPFAAKVAGQPIRANGRECLRMLNGSQYIIVTPNEKAGRSLSIDLAVVDEAWAHETDVVLGAMGGAMSARRFAQIWLLSNAGSYRSKLWRRMTDTGRESITDPRSPVCWQEWGPADDADMTDPLVWREANPTLDDPHGVSSFALGADLVTMDESTFKREHLNLWADPIGVIGIDPVAWAACLADGVPGERVALSLDFTPERDRGSMVVAGDIDGRTPLDVIEQSTDLFRIIEHAVNAAKLHKAEVVIDRASPASSALPAFDRAKIKYRLIGLPEHARACGDFHDAVMRGALTHRGDYRLNDAVAAATRRPVGDSWVWHRRAGADITPLTAATNARWGIVSAPVPATPRIY